jgi:hypothetical protein
MSKIAEALFEITLPRFSGDVFPRTDAGIVLAVADRYLCTQNYPIPDIEKITCMLHLLILLAHTNFVGTCQGCYCISFVQECIQFREVATL